MEKIQLDQILVKGAELSSEKLNDKDPSVAKLIEETKDQQSKILRLKDVDQESLKMVVQL